MTKIYLQWYCYDRRSPPRQPFFCEWSTSQLISRSIAKLSKQYISSPSLYTKKGSPFDIPVPSSFLTKLRWIYVRTDGNRTLTLLLLLNTVIDPWNPWKYSEQIVDYRFYLHVYSTECLSKIMHRLIKLRINKNWLWGSRIVSQRSFWWILF